jgi:zinc transport system substrate-binding protein
LLLFSSALLAADPVDSRSHHVLVSVAPHKFFVEQIAGDSLTVDLMVPAGASSHTFEPSPKQMMAASQADIWFQLGEFFEARATQALKSYNSRMIFVDMRQGLDLISSLEGEGGCPHCRHHDNSMDLHIWMSPKMAMTQAKTIATALSQLYPENQERYAAALQRFLVELDKLDREIRDLLKNIKNRTIMVSHPAYSYFCREYDLKQLSIEFEGKDPTPQQLTRVIEQAREAHIQTIFIQMQYSNKGARLIANELQAKVVMLDPYSENYLVSMREIAQRFAEG